MKLAMMEKEAADKLEQLKIREAQQREQYEAKYMKQEKRTQKSFAQSYRRYLRQTFFGLATFQTKP